MSNIFIFKISLIMILILCIMIIIINEILYLGGNYEQN